MAAATVLTAGACAGAGARAGDRVESAVRAPATPPATSFPAVAQVVDARPAGPTAVVDGAPIGFRHDAAGARAAGLVWARLNSSLVGMDEPAAEAAWRAIAADGSTEVLLADVRARLTAIRQRWAPGELAYRVAPLGVRVVADGPDAMRVDVWYVAVLAGRDLPAKEDWVTETYRLIWQRGDWRVAAFADAPGPRPLPGSLPPAGPGQVEARLADFEAAG